MAGIIWRADADFYGSEEARSLLFDARYLEQTYQQEGEDAALDFGTRILEAIESGEVEQAEILQDQFLRKRRVKDLYEERQERLEVIDEIWRMDDDFYDSIEIRSFLFRVRDENGDLFTEDEDAEMATRMGEALEKVGERELRKVLRAYERHPRAGDRQLAKTLAPALGLVVRSGLKELGIVPRIEYLAPQDDRGKGCYYAAKDRIIVYGNGKAEPVRPGFLLPRTELTDEIFDRINTVAHEMWHAHQHYGFDVDPEMMARYRRNWAVYISARMDYVMYREQLTEREAFMFGGMVEERMRGIYGQREGARKGSGAEARREDGFERGGGGDGFGRSGASDGEIKRKEENG